MNKIEKLQNRQWLNAQYNIQDRSMQTIADELGTNRQRVRRAIIALGITIKDKSSAQKAALKYGRAEHPTEGKVRPEEVRVRIAEGVHEDWVNADKETLKARSDTSKAQWAAMPQHERDALLRAAQDAVRGTAKDGSQVEKYLREGLTNAGYDVEYHVTGIVPNQNLEIDLLLPSLSIAIEVDGPSHFLPIWGEASLLKNIQSDLQKTGLLLFQGMVVIRVKQLSNNVSTLLKRKLLAAVLEAVGKIEVQYPTKNNRLIELEV